MAKSLISVQTHTQLLQFTPGGEPAYLKLTVHNDSEKFATFQVEVIAAGAESNETDKERSGQRWYSLSPEVSSKTPPGASTDFVVVIADSPVPGFVGNMDLIVNIFSLELRDEKVRESVRLVLNRGTAVTPVKVELPVREFKKHPHDRIEVPVRVYNPGQQTANVELSLLGIPNWLADSGKRSLRIAPGDKVETAFLGQIPDATQTISKAYPFTVEAYQENAPLSSDRGAIEVQISGFVEFSCTPALNQIPESQSWRPKWKSNSATYKLQFHNASNLSQQVGVDIKKGEEQQKSWLEVIPETIPDLQPGETKELLLVAKTRRLPLGRARKLLFEVKAVVLNQRLDVHDDTQVLKLRVFPLLPIWMQIVGLLLLLLLLWSLSCFNPANPFCGHKAAVNSVQFNGLSDQVVSGSSDQRMIRWRVDGFNNPLIEQQIGVVGKTGKAVRVIRYRPVDNNLVAAGLENGEIQLWNLTGDGQKPVDSFFYQKDDRVLDLVFTKDSRFLFSGHGSGWVQQWNIDRDLSETSETKKLIRQKKLDFAVYSLALVGKDDNNLAIAGRYNQLAVWNWTADKLYRISYRQGGQDDYITSLTTSPQRPTLLATADNQGYITLWDISKCSASAPKTKGIEDIQCKVLDEWDSGHGRKPIRAIALSANGCYLASAGDDGQVLLWPLTSSGNRASQFLKGEKIDQSSQKFNSVDLKVVEDNILLISGDDGSRVKLHHSKRLPQLGCDKK